MRGAWIEIFNVGKNVVFPTSLPVRGAWIEIALVLLLSAIALVAPCEGSVD